MFVWKANHTHKALSSTNTFHKADEQNLRNEMNERTKTEWERVKNEPKIISRFSVQTFFNVKENGLVLYILKERCLFETIWLTPKNHIDQYRMIIGKYWLFQCDIHGKNDWFAFWRLQFGLEILNICSNVNSVPSGRQFLSFFFCSHDYKYLHFGQAENENTPKRKWAKKMNNKRAVLRQIFQENENRVIKLNTSSIYIYNKINSLTYSPSAWCIVIIIIESLKSNYIHVSSSSPSS